MYLCEFFDLSFGSGGVSCWFEHSTLAKLASGKPATSGAGYDTYPACTWRGVPRVGGDVGTIWLASLGTWVPGGD